MYTQWNLVPLDSLGVLRVAGRDASAFLQGQLSSDLTGLTPERSLLAGYHNPQGRVLALLRILESAPGEALALLPRELVPAVIGRLKGFVLRSKVELADDSASWRIEGLIRQGAGDPEPSAAPGVAPLAAPFAGQLPQALCAVSRLGHSFALRVGAQPPHWHIVSPAASAHGESPRARCAPAPGYSSRAHRHTAQGRAGRPAGRPCRCAAARRIVRPRPQ